ncbi:16S rRNA (uracil(1498)-N(3))-methyltransferase [Helicobacter mehlei]|uniref:Ribosomal RNA small subunit methyltransferase E n=1 Tax=Helicobacter mehlei TaxID=2316080 RepID=A0A553USA7_9HELI|nr:16S rRNA (uracil(1498)-N(3))-methyltransferase [Helicobacter mehlei]TSA83082.1 16S rRNA (uracil(1498)-N(3))-methyltransferase [Helicobacter mehlei]
MRFLYHPQAKAPEVLLEGQAYRHLYLSRRTPASQSIAMRNLQDDNLYFYKPVTIHKKYALLSLQSAQESRICPTHPIHLIWAIIHLKNIEKVLPYLNQMGVSQISFFYAAYSQHDEKLDTPKMERFQKILIASCEQSGRSDLMALEVLGNTQTALETYPKACVFDLGAPSMPAQKSLKNGVIIGPEGGFSPPERALFASREIYSTPSPLILTSEGSALYLAALGGALNV